MVNFVSISSSPNTSILLNPPSRDMLKYSPSLSRPVSSKTFSKNAYFIYGHGLVQYTRINVQSQAIEENYLEAWSQWYFVFWWTISDCRNSLSQLFSIKNPMTLVIFHKSNQTVNILQADFYPYWVFNSVEKYKHINRSLNTTTYFSLFLKTVGSNLLNFSPSFIFSKIFVNHGTPEFLSKLFHFGLIFTFLSKHIFCCQWLDQKFPSNSFRWC